MNNTSLVHPESILGSSEATLAALNAALPNLKVSEGVATQLINLASYRPQPSNIPFPSNRLASVLVLLHLSNEGRLTATLTTRSKKLRSHPGETALPGGRWEPNDVGFEGTAIREAQEEVALPFDAPLLHLTTLSAYTSRTLLIVVPCIYLLLLPPHEAQDYLEDKLVGNEDEVDGIFNVDLEQLLMLDDRDESTSSNDASQPPSSIPSSSAERTPYEYTFTDYNWPLNPPTIYRLHSFSSPSFISSITGLTADILIDTSLIAHYGPEEDKGTGKLGFVKLAESQVGWAEIVKRALSMERNSSGNATENRKPLNVGLSNKVSK